MLIPLALAALASLGSLPLLADSIPVADQLRAELIADWELQIQTSKVKVNPSGRS